MSRASIYNINKNSVGIVFNGFDLFEVLPTNTFILQDEDEEYQPLSSGSEEGEREWSVLGIDAVYVDLATSYIEFTVKIFKQDKTALQAADDNMLCSTNFPHSLFLQGTLSIIVIESTYLIMHGKHGLNTF